MKKLSCSFEVEIIGQNCIFRILSQDFFTFFRRCCRSFEFLGRDEGVFYPKVKKESKNTSRQARTSRDKNAKILTHFQIRKQSKFVSIITFRNRGFVRPALDRLLPGGCSVSVPIFSSIGAIRAGKAAAAAAAAATFYRGQRLEVLNVSLYAAVAAGIFEVF